MPWLVGGKLEEAQYARKGKKKVWRRILRVAGQGLEEQLSAMGARQRKRKPPWHKATHMRFKHNKDPLGEYAGHLCDKC